VCDADLAYTSDVDFDAVLVDGNLVHVRPPVNADRAPLLDLHHGLSERSAYFRYFSLSRHAGEAHVDHLLAADTDILSSLIALIGDDVCGLSSYERRRRRCVHNLVVVASGFAELGAIGRTWNANSSC